MIDSKKLSELPQTSNVASTDRVLVLRDPSGNASTRTVTVGNLAASISSFSNSISVGNYSINSYASSLNFNVDAFVLSNTENANGGFKWYSGNNELVKIERDGHLVVNRIRSRLYANLELYSDGLAGNWKFANDGILYLPNTVGDIYKDGVSVLGAANTGNVTFSNTSYYSGQQITSADPLILRGNNYVTSVINDKNDGFAELWWHNRDFDSGNASNNTPVDADLYVDNNGMWLWAGGLDNSNTYYFHQWHWGMDGMLDIPSGGDIRRDGVSVIGTGQIDGGNAFTTPTAEITVDGGGA